MDLSVVTPYYKTLKETQELAKILIPQLTEQTEWIIIDDGCYETKLDKVIDDIICMNVNIKFVPTIKVIHLDKNSGGASKPRNVGLDIAKGKYITFIDSDDLVSNDYISKILETIKKNTDIIYISWKSKVHDVKMVNNPPRWNCAVWCRVYKRDIIGSIRFDENLVVAEDWKFNQQIKYNTSAGIRKTLYYYNNGREGSLINRK